MEEDNTRQEAISIESVFLSELKSWTTVHLVDFIRSRGARVDPAKIQLFVDLVQRLKITGRIAASWRNYADIAERSELLDTWTVADCKLLYKLIRVPLLDDIFPPVEKILDSDPRVHSTVCAVDAFPFKKVPPWTPDNAQGLKDQLEMVLAAHELDAQKKIFSAALLNPLPCPFAGTVCEWLMHNTLEQEFKLFLSKMTAPDARPEEKSILLLCQEHGAGKTKFAFELSGIGYTLVLSLSRKYRLVQQLEGYFLENNRALYSTLDFAQRAEVPYYSLYVVYAWVCAHLEFLDHYQTYLVPTMPDVDELLQRRLFLILCHTNGMLTTKFIEYNFHNRIESLHATTTPIFSLCSDLLRDITALINKTRVQAIVYDDLQELVGTGQAWFVPGELLDNAANDNDRVKYQQQAMHELDSNVILLPITRTAVDRTFATSASLVTGFFHLTRELLGNSVSFVVAGTDNSVKKHYCYSPETRPSIGIVEHVPNLHVRANDMWKFLNYYFGVAQSEELMMYLKRLEGPASLFFSQFFIRWLLMHFKVTKPKSVAEVTEGIIQWINTTGVEEFIAQARESKVVRTE